MGDVRREGLLCAVEFVEGKNTRTFYDSSKKIDVAVAAAPLKRGVPRRYASRCLRLRKLSAR